MAGRIARGLALAASLALAMSVALAGCGGSARTTAGRPALPTTTPTPSGLLPAFTDWRIASLGFQSTLHVITLDGKTNLTGPTLDANAHNLIISPNGQTVAYLTAPKYGPITLVELGATSPAQSTITVPASVSGLTGTEWSPDGSRLAVSGTLNGAPGLYLVDALTGNSTLVPGTDPNGANRYLGDQQPIAGWTDASHLVISGGRAVLVDMTTGATSALAVPFSMAIAHVAPDGRQALLGPAAIACGSVTPDVAVYDFATGAIRHLPNITAATDGRGPALWQPGTSLAVGLLHPNQVTVLNAALFDLDADTATPLQLNMVPFAWLPDGQTLLLTSHPADGTNGAFYTEHPVAPGTQPLPLPPTITNVIGFVRTAGGPAASNAAPVTASLAPALWNAAHTAGGSTALWGARPLGLPRCG